MIRSDKAAVESIQVHIISQKTHPDPEEPCKVVEAGDLALNLAAEST